MRENALPFPFYNIYVDKDISINVLSVCSSDERDRVQKKTFTKWVNKHLIKVRVIKLAPICNNKWFCLNQSLERLRRLR